VRNWQSPACGRIKVNNFNQNTIESIADALQEPPAQLTMELVPGHSGTQVFMMFLFSFLMYTAMAWVALSLPRWWRRRT